MPDIADRRKEMEKFREISSKSGFRSVLIHGGEGTGKSTLLRAMMSSWKAPSFSYSCSPGDGAFSALRGMLKSGGQDSLFSSGFGDVLAVYAIMQQSGLLISKMERMESGLDPDIFAGMLSAVQSFVRDSMSSMVDAGGYLHSLGYGEFRIIIARGKLIDLVAITRGIEEESLKRDMLETLRDYEESHEDIINAWDGELGTLNMEEILKKYVEGGGSKGELKSNLFRTVSEGLLKLSEKERIGIFLDDVQWMDSDSAEFFRSFLRRLRSENPDILMVFVLNTDIQGNEELMMLLTEMSEGMPMDNMDFDSSVELINFHYPDNLFSEDFLKMAYSETGGNPLKILDFMRYLENSGSVTRDDGFWQISGEIKYQDVSLPEIIRMDDEEREVLEISAVVGHADSALISSVLDIPKIKVLRMVRRFSRLGILEKRGEIYVFTHERYRKGILNSMDSEFREEYSRMVAEYYMEFGDEERAAEHMLEYVDPEAERILEKLWKSRLDEGRYEEAAEILLKLSDFLEKQGKDHASAALKAADMFFNLGKYRRALRIYEKLDVPEAETGRIMCMAHLGMIDESTAKEMDAPMKDMALSILYFREGKFREAKEHAESFLKLGRNKDIEFLLARSYEYLGNGEKSSEIYERLENTLDSGDYVERLRLINRRSGNLLEMGRAEEALSIIEEGIELARKTGDIKAEASLLNSMANAKKALGNPEDGISIYLRAMRIAQGQDDPKLLCIIIGNIGLTYLSMGMPEKAVKYFRKVLKIFESVGDTHGSAFTKLDIGTAYMFMGKWEDARGMLEEAVNGLKYSGDLITELYTEHFILMIDFIESPSPQIAERVAEIYRKMGEFGDFYAEIRVGLAAATMTALLGKTPDFLDKLVEKCSASDCWLNPEIISWSVGKKADANIETVTEIRNRAEFLLAAALILKSGRCPENIRENLEKDRELMEFVEKLG